MSLGRIGKYERLEVIGHGASGIVYLANDTLLRRQVAIKEMNAQGEECERILQEARVLDRLSHPNIVNIYSVDTIDGKIVISMEYVVGENLQEILRRANSPLPSNQAIDIILQTLDGLAYAQSKHVVHRDIKPANILVTPSGHVKLVDFGLAEVLGTNSFVGGAGTYAYMAPEDFEEGEQSGAQADIWAVGVILYETLTGTRPFSVYRAKDPFAWKRAIETTIITPPSEINNQIPNALDRIVATALQHDLELRYATAEQFAKALRNITEIDTLTLLGASDVEHFLKIVPERWEDARAALESGQLTRWLQATGESPLAEVAKQNEHTISAEDSDHDELLRDFLYRAGLDTTAAATRFADIGRNLLKEKQHDEAISAMTLATRLNPRQVGVFVQLVDALKKIDDLDTARHVLDRGLRFHPKDKNLRRVYAEIAVGKAEVTPEFVDFGSLRQGEFATAKAVFQHDHVQPVQVSVGQCPEWMTIEPRIFSTRHKQILSLRLDTTSLEPRLAPVEDMIRLNSSIGIVEIGVAVQVKPARPSFQEIAGWYLPLLILVLSPLLAGEIAAIRHPYHGADLPYYTVGLISSGLFFGSLWQICKQADTGSNERLLALIGACLMPIGLWLVLNMNNASEILGSFVVAALPAALLVITQGAFSFKRSQKSDGWALWGWILGAVTICVTFAFWRQTEWMMRH